MTSTPRHRSHNRPAETRLRVRYAETDQMGVVYYANYLVWMEIARTDFCIAAGFRYSDLEKEEGIAIAVAEASCRYHTPARYDDDIVVRTMLERLRRRTLTFSYEMVHAGTGELLASGHTVHVSLGIRDNRPRALPPNYYALLEAWVAPAPNTSTRPEGSPPARQD